MVVQSVRGSSSCRAAILYCKRSMSHIRIEPPTQANRAAELSQDETRDNRDLAGAMKSMQQPFSKPPRPGPLESFPERRHQISLYVLGEEGID